MTRNLRQGLIIGIVASGLMPAVWAVEQGSATAPKSTPAPAASTASAQPAAIEGSITAVDLQAAAPTLTIRAADGKLWTLNLDLKSSAVWRDSQLIKLDELKPGQSVKVRHLMVGGQDLAQSIRMTPVPKPVASTTSTRTSGY